MSMEYSYNIPTMDNSIQSILMLEQDFEDGAAS
jgi:hypothetical protein